jgi:hypothetical protein
MKLNMSDYTFRVICVLPLTEQVELREVDSKMRFYYKHKYRDSLLSRLNPGDFVSMNKANTRLVKKRGAK